MLFAPSSKASRVPFVSVAALFVVATSIAACDETPARPATAPSAPSGAEGPHGGPPRVDGVPTAVTVDLLLDGLLGIEIAEPVAGPAAVEDR